jgi:orotidine-5'-phosphate decarboxylase
MTRTELIQLIKTKQSFLCVGLDTDLDKIPAFLLNSDDPIFEFNKAIIDATLLFTVAYKPNLAFYERYGEKGWASLRKTIEYIGNQAFIIADAKRGDIGNTASYYADAFFQTLNCDALTVAPYMGKDSIQPFLGRVGKWCITLAMTSNDGARDFQFIPDAAGKIVAEHVVEQAITWGSDEELMFVVGATRTQDIQRIRDLAPNYFFLVPGVGAQGGSLEDVVEFGWNKDCGLLVNSSRGIIYASNGSDFAEMAAQEAQKIQKQMSAVLLEKGFC